LASAQIQSLNARDASLEEEARTGVRIAEGIRKDCDGAKHELIERYSPGLLYLLKRRIGDEESARDLLHDTFCIALQKLGTTDLENPERLAGYLRGIAVRVAFNALRRHNREPIAADQSIVEAIGDPEPRQFQKLSTDETKAAVDKLLDSMPVKRDRELLIRLYVYDQDKNEICQALGLDSLHFNRVLYRAKERFRKIVEGSGAAVDLAPGQVNGG
jgi:RNA polymerase sigma-70 factor (ECF subfamily)